MPKQSDKSRYRSAYDVEDNFITAAQYILEKLCELIASKQKKKLGFKFWKEPEWAKVFSGQSKAVHGLLKEYSPEAILSTIKDRRFWKIASLRAKESIKPILDEYQKIIDIRAKQPVEETKGLDINQKPRMPQAQPTILTKLRSLDV